ncbi:MAG: hypothetical protein Q9208_003128 [Pyrenodesmia sp. 3 TL-2023]
MHTDYSRVLDTLVMRLFAQDEASTSPIVRINPWELHVDDPEFYETIYGQTPSLDKIKSFENRFSMPHASFSTAESSLHKTRRAPLNPFFSTRRIQSQEPLIKTKVTQVCDRLMDAYAGKEKELTLNDLFGCLATDVVMEVAFGHSYNLVTADNFLHPFTVSTANTAHAVHVVTHMPWIVTLIEWLPEDLLMAVSEQLRPIILYRREIGNEIHQILSGEEESKMVSANKPTIFAELLDSKLPAQERTPIRLQHEAISVVGAGMETTKWTLTVAFYYILADPTIHKRLREELEAEIPDPSTIPSWSELQKLPYLSACIEEALRLSYGAIQRSPRIAPSSPPFRYGSYIIPPGTHISTDTYHMHHNERTFPRSHTYDPSRWLHNPKGPDGQKPLSRYMIAFSKGSRMCLGMQLAYAEINLVLATLMRRFDWRLAEGVEAADVQAKRDHIIAVPRDGSKGVRVFVQSK